MTGYGDTARTWSVDVPGLPQPHVLPAVAGFTRVCAYDRPGTVGIDLDDPAQRSRSDPVPQPRSPENAMAELHALVQAAPVPGQYVLAGHSLGGGYVRIFAATYPDAVVGMVLVDASNEYLRAVLTPEQWTAIVAISGGAPPVADYPEMERFDYDTLSDALERAVAALVPNARQMIATESGHVIQLEQPALVIEAIRQAVEGVRQPATWSDLVDCCAS